MNIASQLFITAADVKKPQNWWQYSKKECNRKFSYLFSPRSHIWIAGCNVLSFYLDVVTGWVYHLGYCLLLQLRSTTRQIATNCRPNSRPNSRDNQINLDISPSSPTPSTLTRTDT